jgi:hypothetical protein
VGDDVRQLLAAFEVGGFVQALVLLIADAFSA